MQDKNTKYISIIWHELRTPLTSIRGYLSMILEWDMWEISYEARKALNHCYDSSLRLIKLTNDILMLSKIESWKMEYYPSICTKWCFCGSWRAKSRARNRNRKISKK